MLFLSRFLNIRCNACKNEGASFDVSLDFLSAVVFVTEFATVFLHQLGCIAGKSEHISINIEVFA